MVATTTSPASGIARAPLRNFTGLCCILLISVPVAAQELKLVPMYESQRRMLPAYAAFFCILACAYVVSLRHALARTMFAAPLLSSVDAVSPTTARTQRRSINQLLACLILASIAAATTYLWEFETGRGSPRFPALPPSSVDAVVLALSYIGMFVLAEAAFAIMAVREYLQEVLALSDAEVITGVPTPQTVANVSADQALAARVIPPSTSGDLDLEQFATEQATAAGGRARRGFFRKVRITLAGGE